jgi:hypothetical protein
MWAKASIFRIGPFWPPRRTRTLVVDDGRVLTLDEPAVIDEALALGDKLGGAANLQQQRDATIAVADDRSGRRMKVKGWRATFRRCFGRGGLVQGRRSPPVSRFGRGWGAGGWFWPLFAQAGWSSTAVGGVRLRVGASR